MQIMLGLTTHEPHFSLLREEVRFTGKNAQKRSTAPEETTFHLLHLSLMREYLEFEFGELKVLSAVLYCKTVCKSSSSVFISGKVPIETNTR